MIYMTMQWYIYTDNENIVIMLMFISCSLLLNKIVSERHGNERCLSVQDTKLA